MLKLDQLTAAAHAMNDAIERWRYHESGGDFMVVQFPLRSSEDVQSIECRHFDSKFQAKRYRDVQVTSGIISKLIEIGAIKVIEQ